MATPDDPNTLLTRDATAAALKEAGFPVSRATLATKATRGGGPLFQRFGTRPLYRWGDVLAWAQSRLSPSVTSTSELDGKDVKRKRSDPSVAGSASARHLPVPPVGSGG